MEKISSYSHVITKYFSVMRATEDIMAIFWEEFDDLDTFSVARPSMNGLFGDIAGVVTWLHIKRR